ncbi:MAG: PAS domain S-box protein [Steroidobacteraceae bacterium]
MVKHDNALEVALASIGDAVIITDDEGRASFLNPVAESLTGWTSEEAQGEPLARVLHIVNERTRAPVHDLAAKVLRTGLIQGLANHSVLLSRSGREIPIDDSAAPIRLQDGRTIGVVIVFRDITERRRSELRSAWLASIVESTDDAIVSKNLDGTITSWNPAAGRLFGYSAAEIIGKPITTIIPRELHAEEHYILQCLRRGERIDHFDTVRLAKDGRRIDVSLSISPIRDEDGQVVGASKIARDITDRKKLESGLREEQRLKDEFLATLGHELRNPIAPIYTAAELLSRLALQEDRAASAVGVIQRQTRQLMRLVDDLLDIARITQGRIALEQETIAFEDIVQQGIETAGPLLEEKRQRLTAVSSSLPHLFVRGDRVRLIQCVSNMVTNAAKFTQAGGEIRVTTRVDGEMALIEVGDNGCGIAPELLPRVFDLFVQGDRTLDRPQGGLGIGLAMVKQLVEMHGGSVAARSAGPDQGATFEIRIPRVDPLPAPEPVESAAPAARRRVIVVDDNADAADSLALLLQAVGHDAEAVHSSREALERIKSFKPEIALLDIGLPEIDGYELAKHLRAGREFSGLRLVAVTGYGRAEDRQRACAAGFDDHLVKPVDLQSLERVLAAT